MSKRRKANVYREKRNSRRNRSDEGEQTNRHHRKPKSRGGSNSPENISRVPIRLHHAYNELFGSNPLAHEVARTLSTTWIDPAYDIIVRKKGCQCNDPCQKGATQCESSSSANVAKSVASENGLNHPPSSPTPLTVETLMRLLELALRALPKGKTA